jgi:hypothetical protein
MSGSTDDLSERPDTGAPWGFWVDGSAMAKFHLVLDGRAMLTLGEPGTAPAELSAGDLVLLPHGSAHLMQDHRDSPAPPLDQILAERSLAGGPAAAERLAYGGDGPRTSLLCGGFALAPGLPDNLLSLLPTVLVLDTTSTGISRWLEPAFGLLRHEIARDAPGASAVLAKLADVFLTEIVRRYLASLDLMTATVPAAAAGDPGVRPGPGRVPPSAGRRPRGAGDVHRVARGRRAPGRGVRNKWVRC